MNRFISNITEMLRTAEFDSETDLLNIVQTCALYAQEEEDLDMKKHIIQIMLLC